MTSMFCGQMPLQVRRLHAELLDSVSPQKKHTALGGLESVHVNPINAYESLYWRYLTADCIFASCLTGLENQKHQLR